MGRRTIFRDHIGSWYFLLPLLDVLTTASAAIAAWWALMLFGPSDYPDQIPFQFYYAITLAVFITPSTFSWMGLYRAWRGQDVFSEIRNLTLAWTFVFLLLAALALLTQSGSAFSRLWLGVWYLVGLGGFVTGRVAVRTLLRSLRRSGFDQKRVVLIGAGELSKSIVAHLQNHPWAGIQVMGIFDEKSSGQKLINQVPVLGKIEDLMAFLGDTDNQVDQIWLALPLSEESRLSELLGQLRSSGLDVCYVPDVFGMRMLHNEMVNIAGLPVMNLTATPIKGINRIVKEVEDKILALGILILITPVMAAIAIAIKLTSPGPVLFRQIRHGWDGRPIEVYKFRTMHLQKNGAKFCQAGKNDSRITALGCILRRTSLDELPQFINVLQGRMSVVGPRPHAIEHNNMFEGRVDRYRLRHKVKPGITGWAQVNGYRGETDTLDKMEKRVEHDLFYIENWSFLFDLKIVVLTFFKGFVHKNAY